MSDNEHADNADASLYPTVRDTVDMGLADWSAVWANRVDIRRSSGRLPRDCLL